ncbi:MAG: crossover junction endodeoxyribonuclease RuvC [Deltaproteobacteria bacterium]|nr:crossover junction endodeoxyribonuclease RuvC [Deltaproteobacteria bacterium]MBW2052559.1 crossover junction endodeoxyribonuclease RuvC [Deltaproteobacteria bacterium]MBW2141732.1 crossover junction endodeoxyribonuclease RuvC [Deltaproteobacteria bacterium]MBW2323269.1 crossover junction endodeoxyribonuclease RuvC [Deltaproteobacteria bacterium]
MPVALGIDPGSKITGYGLVTKEGGELKLVAAGLLKTSQRAPLPERLNQIYCGLQKIIKEHSPTEVAVEDIFYAKNVRSAIRLGHMRGIALLAAAAADLPVYEYAPTVIKMAVVGYGRASKEQVNHMVKRLLKTDMDLRPDASDALATAICHINQSPLSKRERRRE